MQHLFVFKSRHTISNNARARLKAVPTLMKDHGAYCDRLIKITLHGLMGPFEMNGKKYNGQVPMTPFGGMLNDKEVASVLTYVRNRFGNKASAITSEQVKKVRDETKAQSGFNQMDVLLKEHPLEK